jgi:hypothetical protein
LERKKLYDKNSISFLVKLCQLRPKKKKNYVGYMNYICNSKYIKTINFHRETLLRSVGTNQEKLENAK